MKHKGIPEPNEVYFVQDHEYYPASEFGGPVKCFAYGTHGSKCFRTEQEHKLARHRRDYDYWDYVDDGTWRF
jgi:hypothetical protein